MRAGAMSNSQDFGRFIANILLWGAVLLVKVRKAGGQL